MKRGNCQGEYGFTLIEVLVSLVILCLLVFALSTISTSAGLWMRRTGLQMQGTGHAVAIMETLRANALRLNNLAGSLPYTLIDSNGTNNELIVGDTGIVVADPMGMAESIHICSVSGDDRLFKAEVTVFWQEGKVRRSTTITSLIGAR